MQITGLRDLDGPGATVIAIGAHADDIEIGAGGTVLRLRETHPALRIVWVVCCAEGPRAAEARAAAAAFGASRTYVEDFPDRHLPSRVEALKRRLGDICREVEADMQRPSLVLAPWRGDRHQAHRVVADLAWQQFRSQPVWAYEIAKYESDLAHPNLLVTLDEEMVAKKLELLARHFPSQAEKPWFDDDLFRALMRLRGVHAGARWAEGFHAEKVVV